MRTLTLLAFTLLALALAACDSAPPTVAIVDSGSRTTPTPVPTSTPGLTPTPAPVATPTPDPTPTPTATATPSPTAPPTLIPDSTPAAALKPTPAATPTNTLAPAPSLSGLARASGWYLDGVDSAGPYPAEPRALRVLEAIDRNAPELAAVMSGWAWIFDEEMHEDETRVIEYVADLRENAPGLAAPLVGLPWVADDIRRWESIAVGDLHTTAVYYDLDFAVELATTPWVVDGVTLLEVLYGIGVLGFFAGEDRHTFLDDRDGTSAERDLPAGPELARQMMGLISSQPSDKDLFLLSRLNTIRRHSPDAFERLLTEPWFVDGLNEEERVLLIAAGSVGSAVRLSDPHTVACTTISLPQSGDVNLWGVWLTGSHAEQTVLSEMEKAVRGSERLWELPFPNNDVILFLEDAEECHRKGRVDCRSQHLGQAIVLFTYEGEPGAESIYHEVAHYYFSAGPSWYAEGGAEFVRLYIANDGDVPAVEFPDYCAEEGIDNLQALNDLGAGLEWDWCRYSMGLHFMTALRDTMGEDAWLAALRAFYLEFGYEGLYVTASDGPEDEDVYQAFMEHTPPELADGVRDVFRRLHGGPFVDAADQVP